MTEKDKQDIADKVVLGLGNVKNACPHGIDAETAISLKDFSDSWRNGKKAAIRTVVVGVTLGLLGLILFAIKEKVKNWVGL